MAIGLNQGEAQNVRVVDADGVSSAPATEAQLETVIDTLGTHFILIETAQADGTQKSQVHGIAKGSTTAADATVESVDANRNGLTVVEGKAPTAEDNSNAVVAFAHRIPLASTYGITQITAKNADASFTGRAAEGVVTGAALVNRNVAARVFGLVNKATDPVNGDTIVLHIPVPATSTIFVGAEVFGPNGFYLSTGVAFAWSTTWGTVTLATDADHDTVLMGK